MQKRLRTTSEKTALKMRLEEWVKFQQSRDEEIFLTFLEKGAV